MIHANKMYNEMEVEQPYPSGSPPYPEGADYNYRTGAHELGLFFGHPSLAEIEAVKRGRAEFAFVAEGPVIFFLYRFRPWVPWGDAAYSWHLLPKHEQTLPRPEAHGAETRALLTVLLIDAKTGIVKAKRAVTLSPSFTQALHAAIREQAASEWWGAAAYNGVVEEAYRRYPTSEDLLRRAAHHTTGRDR
jgi:hypothetical protein